MIELVQYYNNRDGNTRDQILRLYWRTSQEWLVEDYIAYIKEYYGIFEENFYREHPALTDEEMLQVLLDLEKGGRFNRLPEQAIRYYMINCFWQDCDLRRFAKQDSDYIFDAWIRDQDRLVY